MALRFPGNSGGADTDYLVIPDIAAQSGATAFSVSCWFYHDDTSASGNEFIYGAVQGTGGASFQFFYNLGTAQYRTRWDDNLGAMIHNIAGAGVSTGVWHHYACRYNGSQIEVFLDGVSQGTASGSGSSLKNVGAVHVGAPGSGDGMWDGGIAELATWAATLSNGEIAALAAGVGPAQLGRAMEVYMTLLESSPNDYSSQDLTISVTGSPALGAHPRVAGQFQIGPLSREWETPVIPATPVLYSGRALDSTAVFNQSSGTSAVGTQSAYAIVVRMRCADNSGGSDAVGLYDEDGTGLNLLTLQLKQSGAINFFYRNGAGDNISITSSAGFDDDAEHTILALKRASNDYELIIDGTSEGTASTTVSAPTLTATRLMNGNASAAGGMLGPVWAFRQAITWTQVVELLAKGAIDGVSPEAEWYPALADTTTSVVPERHGNTAYDLTPTAACAFTTGPDMTGFTLQAGAVPVGTLLALGTDLYNSDGTNFRASTDDGALWSNPAETVTGTNFTAQYGGMAADGSTVHILLPQSDPGSNPVTTQHRKTTDDGANWSSATTLQDDVPSNAQFRRVQMDAAGGEVHIVGLEKSDGSGGTSWYVRSQDGGSTFDDGVEVAIAECQPIAYDPSDGHVYIAGHDTQDSGVVKVVVSTDGGDNFGSPVTLSGTATGARERAVAARGHAVVAWQEENDAPLEDIYVSISGDGGSTWSSPILAMDATTLGIDRYNHFDVAIYGSVVHIAAVSVDSPSGGPVHYAYSLDWGATWSTPEIVHGGETANTVWNIWADLNWVHITTGGDTYIRRTAPTAHGAGPLVNRPTLQSLINLGLVA